MNIRTPFILKLIYPSIICRVPTTEKKLFLTFDDGPIPDVTLQVIEHLNKYNAKATFFCVGDNVKKHPSEYAHLQRSKHAVGNHTQHHLNGFKTATNDYINNVAIASNYVHSKLFRPPYGRMKPAQYFALKNNYKIVMWDVLSYDYDAKISAEQCLHNVIDNSRSGSIIVFHDSIKAADKMLYVLPKVLEHFSEAGFAFESLADNNLTVSEIRV